MKKNIVVIVFEKIRDTGDGFGWIGIVLGLVAIYAGFSSFMDFLRNPQTYWAPYAILFSQAFILGFISVKNNSLKYMLLLPIIFSIELFVFLLLGHSRMALWELLILTPIMGISSSIIPTLISMVVTAIVLAIKE